MEYLGEFDSAKKIALEVGEYLTKQVTRRVESEVGKDIKLELDRNSEELIIQKLNKNYDYPILSEERGLTSPLQGNKPFWIIDPIDGTLNFSRYNPSCCISIALWIDQEPVFGVIHDFNRNELFSGYVGLGSWLNDTKLTKLNIKEKSRSILATGFPTYMNDDDESILLFLNQVQSYKKIRMIGSAALSLAYVACGRFDAYIERDSKLWDVAAGIAINHAIFNEYEIVHLENFKTYTKVGII